MPIITLHPQRHKRVVSGHPWVYSNEIVHHNDLKNIAPGSLVQFCQHGGNVIGIGFYNPHSLIAGRILSRHAITTIDQDWLEEKICSAVQLRDQCIGGSHYRLIHAEADGLPGLIVDRFHDMLSVQINTAGIDLLWPSLLSALNIVIAPKGIVVRRDSPVRSLEKIPLLPPETIGTVPEEITVQQNNLEYFANLASGQKTGWYFDQRDNHALVARYAKNANSVLDLFTHAGGFALLAAKAGAKKVIGVDSSAPALALAAKGAKQNTLNNCTWVEADVFSDLERRITTKEKFSIVVADPPPFVRSRKDAASGGRAYRKLAKQSAQVTEAGGLLYIASCSYNMSLNDFQTCVAEGLTDAKRSARLLYTTFAAPDHPMHPMLPESGYLKGFLLQLD